MDKRIFEQIWSQLRAKKRTYEMFLDDVTIEKIRGIDRIDLRFEFPVTVIAGQNATGKTTCLLACAACYENPEKTSGSQLRPSTIFPNFSIKNNSTLSDSYINTELKYTYTEKKDRKFMKYKRASKGWSKSFEGAKGGRQPKRIVYLRTLANLVAPSEIRSVLQITRNNVESEVIPAHLIAFGQSILGNRYKEVHIIKSEKKDILFAVLSELQTEKYSELHMSSGERTILRLSKDLSGLKQALVLIDEIEAGLHPLTQKLLMLELQRIALRNDLQIIVTTHSPVIIESVPIEARIFLEKINNEVKVQNAYRDIIQKALYGQSLEKLSILCEDEEAEGFLWGVMDYLNPKLGLVHGDFFVGKDTSKDKFVNHIETLGVSKNLDGFIFVLDGDARNLETKLKQTAGLYGYTINPLFLPGDSTPEKFIWSLLYNNVEEYTTLLGLSKDQILNELNRQDQIYNNATDKESEIWKNKLSSFAQSLSKDVPILIREIIRQECQKEQGDIKVFTDLIENEIIRWRNRQ